MRILHSSGCVLVPVTRLERARCCQRGILSPLCLPFHHTGIFSYLANLSLPGRDVKQSLPNGEDYGRITSEEVFS